MGLGIYLKTKEIINYAYKKKHENNIQPIFIPKYETKLLEERKALIIGGSGGIGKAISRAFADSGCNVVITASSWKTLEGALLEIDSNNCRGTKMDLINVSEFESEILKAEKQIDEKKPFDIFVYAAGFHGNEKFGQVTEEEYDKVLDINLKGLFFMLQVAGDYMKKRHIKGNILNVSSAASLKPCWTPYEVSKWGVRGLTLGAADELIKYGITVNAIGPGPVATKMLGREKGDTLYTDCVPAGRFATPEEIANLSVIMVSDLCKLVIGDTFYISGGSGTIRYR